MNVKSLSIEGLLILEPSVFTDHRGYFMEPFNQQRFQEATGLEVNFVQDNESGSLANTMRGLHFQIPPAQQGKLVRVCHGAVLDIAVDLRTDSPTFGQHQSVILSAKNRLQFWIPPGFAHGFLTLEDQTIFSYKCTGFYNKECERNLLWNDPDLGIDWGNEEPVISDKDAEATPWQSFESPFTL